MIFLVVFSNSFDLLKQISCDGDCYQRFFGTCIPRLSHKNIKHICPEYSCIWVSADSCFSPFLSSKIPHLESGHVAFPSLCQTPNVTSFEAYASGVIGHRFEKVINAHGFENWTSIYEFHKGHRFEN